MRKPILALGLGVLLAGGLCAQQPKPLIGVATFKVKPEKSGEWLETMKKLYTGLLEKLLNEGAVTVYGIGFDVLHRPGQVNASVWFETPNFAAYGKVVEAIQQIQQKNPAWVERLMAYQDAEAHRDLLLQMVEANGRAVAAGTLPYTMVSVVKAREGTQDELIESFKKYSKPVLDKLVAEGAINFYSLLREALHGEDPATVYFVVSMNDLGGIDKMFAAEAEAVKALPEGERKTRQESLRKLADMTAHRDWLMRAAVFAMKQ
jgi:hypothetical protein